MRVGLSQVSASLLREIRKWAAGPTPHVAVPDGDTDADARTEAPLLIIEDFGEAPWASLTFSGTRHRVDIRLEGEGLHWPRWRRALRAGRRNPRRS